MALTVSTAYSLHPKPLSPLFPFPKHQLFFKFYSGSASPLVRSRRNSCSFKAAAQSEETGVTDEETSSFTGSVSSTRTQLNLLEQLTSTSSSTDGSESDGSQRSTIHDQLAKLVGDRDDDFSIPLGKNLKKVTAKFLTISQKRNIKRQAYLDEVSQRNDSRFFATIGAFVILPPLIILGVAVLTGYVELFP